jgi:hypothetical protein
MSKVSKKMGSTLSDIIKMKLRSRFDSASEEIKRIIIEKYDAELVGVVTDRESKTNPIFYREEFIDRLDKFTYFTTEGESVSLKVPDMENFDFSGRLEVIESIMEGLAGLYVEMNAEDYKAVFNKPPINTKPFDDYIPPKERIYLVRYSNRIKKAEKDLDKEFVRYPFSNTPPIQILEEADRFVDQNLSSWIEESLEEAQKEFVRNFRGV